MQSHLFATPQILFVGLADDFSKKPDIPQTCLGIQLSHQIDGKTKKGEKGRNHMIILVVIVIIVICHQYLL